jgi:outer membrane protein assembly factor BamE
MPAALPGCSIPSLVKPYRMEIQQGNFITQEQVEQLKDGMSREQVRFVLGTPLLTDVFHADRWDYIYRRQKARSDHVEERRLTIHFENNRLARIEGDDMPPRQSAAGEVK